MNSAENSNKPSKGLKELAGRMNLLCHLIRQGGTPDLKVDLAGIEKIIRKDIPDALKNNAPDDFYLIYGDFVSEYEKFKDFILYDELIGKNIVALGGGFSSGKSSFLNALMGKSVLPADINPSTSVPTFIVQGNENVLRGINIFDTKIDIRTQDIKKISHGFGILSDSEANELIEEDVTTGHILESMFLSTPLHAYQNLAFLDTPGYSRADSDQYSKKTDEQIARRQLNSANFILWFVQSDAGTVTEEDIKFIKTLREDIPKLVILSKADKKPSKDLGEIIDKIKSTLDLKGIRYVDVLAFSAQNQEAYDIRAIETQIQEWNHQIYESEFARNFKILFMRCREFYEEEMEAESRRLNRLNKVKTLSDDDAINENIEPLIKDIQKNIVKLKELQSKLKELQQEFFTEIKSISDIVGIAMPEPSEIDLIQDRVKNPMQVLSEYKAKHNIKTEGSIQAVLQEILFGVKPILDQKEGGSRYQEELLAEVKRHLSINPGNIRFNEVYQRTEEYRSLLAGGK